MEMEKSCKQPPFPSASAEETFTNNMLENKEDV